MVNLIRTMFLIVKLAFYLVFFAWATISTFLMALSMVLTRLGNRQDARRLKAANAAIDKLSLDKATALTAQTEQVIVKAVLEVA